MKGAQSAAIRRAAFREQQQMPLLLQVRAQLLIDLGALMGAALDEQRSGLIRQPAQQWPVPHFRLGQERQRCEHAEQRNIQP